MIKILVSASLILATISITPAEASRRHFWWLETTPTNQTDDGFYDDRFDEQDQFVQDQFNQEQYDLYMKRKLQKKKLRYEQAYYEPTVEAPPYKPRPKKPFGLKTVTAKPIAKPTTKLVKMASATSPISKRFETPTLEKTISCSKGAGIVAGYGFGSVSNKSCAGATFVYGATRSGKNFEIEVNSKSGELTAVKKL